MAVPFLSRLRPMEFFALVGSFILVALEAVIRVMTLALPPFLVSLFYRASRRIFNKFSSPEQQRAENNQKSISTSIRDASDFVELCQLWGYEAEEHVAQTKDGYLLGLHRLQWRRGEEGQKVNCGSTSIKKKVIYMHHGLLMNSEVWVCLTDRQRCLPFELVERGYDVWFGNNRGNKYSKKSIHSSPRSTEFWDFSIDEFAFHDIPDSIAYILDTTQQESLSYIGFSQGTAQAFATLAIHPKLNAQVNVFIALAPAMAPAGLSNGIVDALMKASPQVLFLLFGRRSILSSATMWETLLYPPLFSRMIDMSLSFLFKWRTRNITPSQKLAAYPHLYSFTSTKSVVHWFQIIRHKCFQMYDDDVHQPMSLSTTNRYSKVAKYPTRNIKTPIVLVYGGSDSLVDIKTMLRELPSQTVATEIPHYEHLDFLWARDVNTQVFQHVFDALDSFTNAGHSKEEYEHYYMVRSESLVESGFVPGHGHSESVAWTTAVNSDQANTHRRCRQHRAREPHRPSEASTEANGTNMLRAPISGVKDGDQRPATPDPKSLRMSASLENVAEGTDSPSTAGSATKGNSARRGSFGSTISVDSTSMKAGRGISIGASKAVSGVITKSGGVASVTSSPTSEESKGLPKKRAH